MALAKPETSIVTDLAPFEAESFPAANAQTLPTAYAPAIPLVDLGTLADEGLEGLIIDWTSFPTVVLKGSMFEDGSGKSYGKEFNFTLIQTREEFVYKALGEGTSNKRHMVYSSTKPENAMSDPKVATKIQEWAEEGRNYEVKKYLKPVVKAYAPGTNPEDGDMVVLSIPETSAGRLTPSIMKAKTMCGHWNRATFTASVGAKITNCQYPYFPWSFSVSR